MRVADLAQFVGLHEDRTPALQRRQHRLQPLVGRAVRREHLGRQAHRGPDDIKRGLEIVGAF
jgi:hypothetical protein